MKKIALVVGIFTIFAATVFPVSFQPTVLKLTAAPAIKYNFDGTNLNIPVKVAGAPADVSFLVFTKGKGSSISKITNGFLGWHYVNKIDTCVYMSASNTLGIGEGAINWNGRGKDGVALVPAGEYTYYMFGYDNKNARVKMTQQLTNGPWNIRTYMEKDTKGLPLAKPILYMGDGVRAIGTAVSYRVHTNKKWIVGNDPEDKTLLETCSDMGYSDVGGLAFLPTNYNVFFHETMFEGSKKITKKYTWVPNGVAVQDNSWGINGEFSFTDQWIAGSNYGPGVVSDGKDMLMVGGGTPDAAGLQSRLFFISADDGSLIKMLDIAEWWTSKTDGLPEKGGSYGGGPTEICFRNNLIALGAHPSCVNSLMDPYQDTTESAVLWVNRNGDIIGDHYWEPTSKAPWVCNDHIGPYKYSTSMDDKGFVIFPAYDMGAVSFGLYAPDGTGVAYKAFSGETAFQKYGNDIIDYDSMYDGIYTTQTGATSSIPAGIWFIAHDSIKGLITNSPVGVEEAAPGAFSVAQNTPNPFNPTTTINFTLAKAGKVTVDIYNIGGQKVDTVVNTSMNSGSHSVTWNASKFSAGVYFYTVKSGEFSKTIKMTLLK